MSGQNWKGIRSGPSGSKIFGGRVLDGLSLDQVRAFIAAADGGSFSAAARRVGRAQSAISELVRGLELQLGVDLFDRSGRLPILTDDGKALLIDARAIVTEVDALKARARGIVAGLEAELSVVVSMLFPIEAIAEAARDFREAFPAIPLRLQVDAMGGALQPVLDRRASVGIVGPWPAAPPGIVTESIDSVAFATVAAPQHPLAAYRGTIPNSELAKHTQLVITDRSEWTDGQEFGVVSTKVWRFADLSAKQVFLRSGLGWGGMPWHAVQSDLEAGRLVALSTEERGVIDGRLRMSAAYLAERPPGPGGRWLIERLRRTGNRVLS